MEDGSGEHIGRYKYSGAVDISVILSFVGFDAGILRIAIPALPLFSVTLDSVQSQPRNIISVLGIPRGLGSGTSTAPERLWTVSFSLIGVNNLGMHAVYRLVEFTTPFLSGYGVPIRSKHGR